MFSHNLSRCAFCYSDIHFQISSTRFSTRLALSDEKPRSSGRRSIITLDPITEITPTKDLRDVSTFLKHPFSPENDAPSTSPPPSPTKSLIERLQDVPVQSVVQRLRGQEILQNGNKLVMSLRSVSPVLRACVGGVKFIAFSFCPTLATFGLSRPLSSWCIFYRVSYRGKNLKCVNDL